MTVHTIQFRSGLPHFADEVKVKEEIKQLKNELNPVLQDEEMDIGIIKEPDEEEEYMSLTYRFKFEDSVKTDFIDPIMQKANDVGTGWAIIRHHECNHDSDSSSSCGWEYEERFGTVPGWA